MVHHERFLNARKREEPPETLLRHAQAAEKHYIRALRLCPRTLLTDLAPMHHQLGNLYADVGQLDDARDHYEQAAQYHENAGDHFDAGEYALQHRRHVCSRQPGTKARRLQQRDFLLRARAYAEAALRDFQHYQGRAADDGSQGSRPA